MRKKSPDIEFLVKEKLNKLIKVIGVGGAGSNAVNYMYENEPLQEVEYIVCNTDLQALNYSPVPTRIQIGKKLTGGLGAGNKPETGKKAALEDLEDVRKVLEGNTRMLFITAGMGGGTGTGAAPEIARLAREMGILTVAVVTVPFHYEGPKRLKAARQGIEELRNYVDSLLVVDNQKLIDIHGDLDYEAAFHKSDEVLANAVKSVSQVIMSNYHINVDFNDIETILRDSGTALLGTAQAEGTDRAKKVIEKALHSPLLNDNRIDGAKNVLLLIVSGTEAARVNEISFINEYIRQKAGDQVDIILGLGKDPSLEKKLAVTVIATGFRPDKQQRIIENPPLVITLGSNDEPDYMPEDNYHDVSLHDEPAVDENDHATHSPEMQAETAHETDAATEDALDEREVVTPEPKKELTQMTLFDFIPDETRREETTRASEPVKKAPKTGMHNQKQASFAATQTEAEPEQPSLSDEDANFFIERMKKKEEKKEQKKRPDTPAAFHEPVIELDEQVIRNLKKFVFRFPGENSAE